MARPQLENGHTQIANEILECLMRVHLSPNQWQVLLCIIRKTYGFHKKVDYIANFQIIQATGLCKAVVSRALRELEDKNLITRKGKYIGFQKDWEKWGKLAVSSTIDAKLANQSTSEKLAILHEKVSNSAEQLAISATKVSSPASTQKIKETITKDTIQKKGMPKKSYGEFSNVLLTDEEYKKIEQIFGGNGVINWIEELSRGIASKGYKYKNHYATILTWARRDEKNKNPPRATGQRQLPTDDQRRREFSQ